MILRIIKSDLKRISGFLILYILLFALTRFQCTPEPQAIRYGKDQCIQCKMIISDTRYGSELVTAKAKVYKFDSVECLAAYLHENNFISEDIHSLWVTNFLAPQNLVNVHTAAFLHSPQLPSPMGLNLTAFADSNSAQKLSGQYPGTVMNWRDAQFIVNESWMKERR